MKDISKRKNDTLNVSSYNYDQLSHWFIYSHEYRSTAGGRMKCFGTYMYSYNTPISRIISTKVLLVTDQNYSQTTNRQIKALIKAASHMSILRVKDVEAINRSAHIENLKDMYKNMLDFAGKAIRARSEWTKNSYLSEYHYLIENAKQYAKVFKVRNSSIYKKIILLKEPNKEELSIILFTNAKNEAKQAKKRLKQKKIEHTKKCEKAQADLEDWLQGGSTYPDTEYLDKIYIRIKGSYIETTQFARASLKLCKIAYNKYKQGKLEIDDLISGFAFKGVKDNCMTIGCHTIELEQIEQLLGDN